jgi:hypothetical protein
MDAARHQDELRVAQGRGLGHGPSTRHGVPASPNIAALARTQ